MGALLRGVKRSNSVCAYGRVGAVMVSNGQRVFEAWAGWISGWIAFPAVPGNQRLLLTLWAMHTWFAPNWPVTAYLHLRSDGPGCGKTTAMKVLGALCPNPRLVPTLRTLSVVRDIEENHGKVTYFFDQVEALQAATKVSEEQAILLTGYQEGATHRVTVGSRQQAFNIYCAKAFACIGDIVDDLRSRSIVVRLSWGQPERDWAEEVMTRKGEAETLAQAFRTLMADVVPGWTPPEFFARGTREREIFTPLWSVANALKLDAATMRAIRQAMEDSSEFKRTAAKVTYRDLIGVKKDESTAYAERVLRDLVSVLPESSRVATGNIHTAVAIEMLKALDGPWRVFQGRGLDADLLANLLSRFSSVEKGLNVRMVKGRKGQLLKGYNGAQLREALRVLESGGAVVGVDGPEAGL